MFVFRDVHSFKKQSRLKQMFLIVEEFRKIILSINFFLKCKCKIFNSSDKAPFHKEEKGKGKENEKWGKKKKKRGREKPREDFSNTMLHLSNTEVP